MSSVDPTVREAGYPQPDPQPAKQLPPGGARWLAPHYLQANAFLNYVSRTYPWSHDEALRSGACNTDAMWSDLVINGAIRARQMPVVQQEHQFEPRDSTNPDEELLAEDLTQIFEDIPDFQGLKLSLTEALWLGRAGVQVVLKWDAETNPNRKRLVVDRWSPIHGDSLVFKFDGTPGILVNPLLLNTPHVERIEHYGGAAYFPPPDKQQCLLVHEFERAAAPYNRPEMSGAVHGTGLRGRIYWYWWLKHNLSRYLHDFIRKAGQGFFLAGYAAGNKSEYDEIKNSLEAQAGNVVLYVPTDPSRDLDKTLKHIGVNLSGSELQLRVIQYLDELIRDTILLETNANSPAPGGIGGSHAEQRGMGDDERVKYDAIGLQTPLQKLSNTIARNMRPGVKPPRFKFLCDKRNPLEVIEAVDKVLSWGMGVPETWVQEQLGVPAAKANEKILSLVQPQQATALGAVPAGVPMAGMPGPVPPDSAAAGAAPGGMPVDPNLAAQIQPPGIAA